MFYLARLGSCLTFSKISYSLSVSDKVTSSTPDPSFPAHTGARFRFFSPGELQSIKAFFHPSSQLSPMSISCTYPSASVHQVGNNDRARSVREKSGANLEIWQSLYNITLQVNRTARRVYFKLETAEGSSIRHPREGGSSSTPGGEGLHFYPGGSSTARLVSTVLPSSMRSSRPQVTKQCFWESSLLGVSTRPSVSQLDFQLSGGGSSEVKTGGRRRIVIKEDLVQKISGELVSSLGPTRHLGRRGLPRGANGGGVFVGRGVMA